MQDLHVHDSAKIAKSVQFKGNGKIMIGAYVIIDDNVILDSGQNSESYIIVKNRVKIKTGTILQTYSGSISISERTTIGPYSCISGHGGIIIENHVLIASHCTIHAASHIHCDSENIRFQGEIAKGITIKSNCWIGTHVSILDNVKIGQNTIIGAGSVVTKNMPKNSICYGVPCKKIKNRS